MCRQKAQLESLDDFNLMWLVIAARSTAVQFYFSQVIVIIFRGIFIFIFFVFNLKKSFHLYASIRFVLNFRQRVFVDGYEIYVLYYVYCRCLYIYENCAVILNWVDYREKKKKENSNNNIYHSSVNWMREKSTRNKWEKYAEWPFRIWRCALLETNALLKF